MMNAEISGDKQAEGSKRSVLEKRAHMLVNGAIHQVEHKGDDRLQASSCELTNGVLLGDSFGVLLGDRQCKCRREEKHQV